MVAKIVGFTLLDKIEETRGSLVFRAKRNTSGESVVIKIPKIKNTSPAEVARFLQEYALIKNIDLDAVLIDPA